MKSCTERWAVGEHRQLQDIISSYLPYSRRYSPKLHAVSAVFIACHSSDNRVFTDREVSKAIQNMDMTFMKASSTAY